MTYHNTISAYLKKCQDAATEIEESLENLETTRKAQRDQLMVVSGQIAALEALLDPDLNHNVEMPFAGDDIEELHAKRLEGQDGLDQDEVRKFREKHAYVRESAGIVEQIHESNEELANPPADALADSS
jgi:DNA repair exonuclease SbcCD ATPase subunit